MKPPYLILHKQNRILNTPNSVACVFDDSGSKCKMMYHFKISAFAGMTALFFHYDAISKGRGLGRG